jgi:hypothetical protein
MIGYRTKVIQTFDFSSCFNVCANGTSRLWKRIHLLCAIEPSPYGGFHADLRKRVTALLLMAFKILFQLSVCLLHFSVSFGMVGSSFDVVNPPIV